MERNHWANKCLRDRNEFLLIHKSERLEEDCSIVAVVYREKDKDREGSIYFRMSGCIDSGQGEEDTFLRAALIPREYQDD